MITVQTDATCFTEVAETSFKIALKVCFVQSLKQLKVFMASCAGFKKPWIMANHLHLVGSLAMASCAGFNRPW
eukprot:5519172-Amphidinium_carterae.1